MAPNQEITGNWGTVKTEKDTFNPVNLPVISWLLDEYH